MFFYTVFEIRCVFYIYGTFHFVTGHISSVQEPHVDSGYHNGQHILTESF